MSSDVVVFFAGMLVGWCTLPVLQYLFDALMDDDRWMWQDDDPDRR